MRDHDAELDAIVALLSQAGMVEVYVNEDGKPTMRLTPTGERVARPMAMIPTPSLVPCRTPPKVSHEQP